MCEEDLDIRELELLYESVLNVYDGREIENRDKKLVKFVLDTIYLNDENRLVVPCLWDYKVLNKLPKNFGIAKKILHSVYDRLKNDETKLMQYDQVISDQIRDGILESSGSLKDILDNPSATFVAHNAVFRPLAESTKCRLVLLSNLCEKGSGNTLSHNQVSIPGPQVNNKIVTTCILYRFNKYLMIYDLEKAFLQLCLRPEDSEKLNILWFKDVQNKDYSLMALKFKRLPFGLRFSPFLLMISLYYMLIVNNSEISDDISNMLFNLCYMDNFAFSANNARIMIEAFESSVKIFSKYSFNLQQFVSNCDDLNERFTGNDTSSSTNDVKLFGMLWNNKLDELSCMSLT